MTISRKLQYWRFGRVGIHLRLAICGGSLVLALGANAQSKPNPTQQATPSIQTQLEQAIKIQNRPDSIAALQKTLAAARKAKDRYGEGEALYLTGLEYEPDDKYDEAIACFKAACEVFTDLHDLAEAATSEDSEGNDYRSLSKPALAVPILAHAVATAKKAGDPTVEANALLHYGLAFLDIGQFTQALNPFNEALALDQKAHDVKKQAVILTGLGVAYDNLGQAEKALALFNRALPLRKQANDEDGQATTLGDRGDAYLDLGRYADAMVDFKAALAIQVKVGDLQGQAVSLNDLGSASSEMGLKKEALDYLSQSLPLRQKLHDKDGEATAFLNIGVLYDDVGQKEKALDDYKQALDLYEQVGDVSGKITVYNNMGTTYFDLHQYDKSLAIIQQALELAKAGKDRGNEITSLTNMSAVYVALGQKDKALEVLRRSLTMAQELGLRRKEGATLAEIATAEESLGHHELALETYGQALPVLRSTDDRDAEAHALDNMSFVCSSMGVSDLAILFDKEAVNVYQSLRANLKQMPADVRKSYVGVVLPTYRRLSDLLIKAGRIGEAQEVMDFLKEQERFDFVQMDTTRAGVLADKIQKLGIEQGWWDRWQALQDKASAIYLELSNLKSEKAKLELADKTLPADKADRLKELESQKADLQKGVTAYLDAIRQEASTLNDKLRQQSEQRLEGLKTGVLARLRDMKAQGTNVAAIYAVSAPDELNYIIVTASGFIPVSLPISSDKLNALVASYRGDLIDPSVDPRPKGLELYNLLMRKVMEQVEQSGAQRVMWCLDGTLRYIPLAALWDGKQYLIERNDFTMFDPLHMDVIVAPVRGNRQVAAFASSKGKLPKYSPLPGAGKEIHSIVDEPAQGFNGPMPGKGWEDPQFTAERLQAAISDDDFSMLHIATHFDLGKDFTTSSVLMGDGTELSLAKFMDWCKDQQLGHVDLLCLSACNTAETIGSPDSDGSQLDSFVSLALGDGAKSVIASLWPVSDESTPLLMQRFYQNWKAHPELGKGEALRQAQLALLHGDIKSVGQAAPTRSTTLTVKTGFDCDRQKPFAHPFYWAPFLMFGNWN